MLVYVVLCHVNNKRYVGQTTKATATARLQVHIKNSKQAQGTTISRAIRKHGAANFSVKELQRCTDQTDLDRAERGWIAALGTLALAGYNVALGGNGRGSVSPATCERIAASKRGKPRPTSVGDAVRRAQTGRLHSPEQVESRIAPLRGRKNGPLSVAHAASIAGENAQHAKLTWPLVRQIRAKHQAGATTRSLASEFKASQSAICLLVNNKTWKEEHEQHRDN